MIEVAWQKEGEREGGREGGREGERGWKGIGDKERQSEEEIR